ncbi:MAG: Flp pilus assembly complex ATPase component TadA [Candidatus Omnitrophica bacterium]|nr:Flp pilus assembly complex ATPase component TadA [Candidatus Omnitrophota bacterium]
MIKQADRLLAKELIDKGLLTPQAIDSYFAEIQTTDETFSAYLLRHGYVSERQVLDAMSGVFQIPIIDLKKIKIDRSIIKRVPVRFSWHYKIMPVKIKNKTLILASAWPLDVKVRDEIRVHLGLEPQTVLASESDIVDALNKYYGLAADTVDRLAKDMDKQPVVEEHADQWVEDLEETVDEASIAKLVNQILLGAYTKRATDIHIEPYRNKVRVRYRIDGVLIDANIPQGVKQFLPSIISRIKIMANLSIVDKRVPQDGSAVVKTKDQDLDLRISTIPTPRGESMVIRILPTKVMLLSLGNLGLDQKNLRVFRQLVSKPHGIILITGPTGSGKTTTLYACLNEMNSIDRKIITLEDPIEYEMEGITQIQVNPRIKLDFATGLRSVLRHDPDVIMVGEIRDIETAETAIRTALTGHTVFSTLHTNDAASGVTRLLEMGLQPYMVASSIEAFVAQRLVRIICPMCKEEIKKSLLELREEIAASMQIADIDQVRMFKGRGCEHCNQTGFYGRTAIYEILAIDEDIRAAILEKRNASHIKRLAMQKGMVSLRQDGWQKVLDGITTPMEVLNVTVGDEIPEKQEEKQEEKMSTGEKTADEGEGEGRVKVVTEKILTTQNRYDTRTYPRLPGKVEIQYAIVRQDKKNPRKLTIDKMAHNSITKNISAGGLCFISGYALAVRTIIELKIQLGPDVFFDCLARVCRVEEELRSSLFDVSAYFLDISSGDRARIEKFVNASIGEDDDKEETEVPEKDDGSDS